MAKATKKSSPVVHHLKSVHVHHLPPAVDLVVGPSEIGGPAEPAPAAVVQAKTSRGNYQQDRAIGLMLKYWPPNGPSKDMTTVIIRQRIAIELGRENYGNKAVPSYDSIRRARRHLP